MGSTLRPMYILYEYMDPQGLGMKSPLRGSKRLLFKKGSTVRVL